MAEQEKTKISVIVPVYKAEAWLARCVDSILAQTFQDLEVILVDDGSPDGSGVLCDGYAAADSRVKAIHKANGGVSSARNAGIEAASGEWVAFVDSDDWLEPTYIAELAEQGAEKGCDLVIGGMCLADGTAVRRAPPPPKQFITKSELLENFWKYFDAGYLTSACGKLFRKARVIHGFCPQMRCGEDTRFNMDFLKGAEQIALADTDGYCCFVPANASGTTKYPQRNVREFSLYIGGVGELLAQAPPGDRDPERYDAFVFRSMCGDMKWISLSRTLDEAKTELARYLALPDVRQALAHRAWRGMALPFRLLGLLLRARLTGAAVRCCKWGRG